MIAVALDKTSRDEDPTSAKIFTYSAARLSLMPVTGLHPQRSVYIRRDQCSFVSMLLGPRCITALALVTARAIVL